MLDPRLSWNCEGGITQTAYHIVAETEGITVWDSGKVVSSCMHVRYPKQLLSRQRVSWRVHLWDENDDADEGVRLSSRRGFCPPPIGRRSEVDLGKLLRKQEKTLSRRLLQKRFYGTRHKKSTSVCHRLWII